ncbi:MAG: AlkA N-terminal domain-containing protein [Solirubrobacteraceae bacterium]
MTDLLDHSRHYQLIARRDPLCDGAVFAGVMTTGVYCRPSCPGRPKPENVHFFASIESARAAGLRPCRRCRPDFAPARAATLRLPATPPFDGDRLLAYLAARAVPGVEEVIDGAYRRSLRLTHGTGVVELRPRAAHVELAARVDDARDLDAVTTGVRHLFDLGCDPAAVDIALGSDEVLGPLRGAAPGLRVPGHPDGYELAVRAVLGQQISVAGARTLAGRLVARYGNPLARPVGTVTHTFPSPEQLAAADPETLPMPASRKRTLQALAATLAADPQLLDRDQDHARARATLDALPGFGPWTLDYIAMRAFGDPDVLLAADLGVRRALERLGLDGSPVAATRLGQRWRPFRSYATLHLWSVLAAATPSGRAMQP